MTTAEAYHAALVELAKAAFKLAMQNTTTVMNARFKVQEAWQAHHDWLLHKEREYVESVLLAEKYRRFLEDIRLQLTKHLTEKPF